MNGRETCGHGEAPYERVLGYRAFRDLETGGDELLVQAERGRFVVESSIPCERAIGEGRLFTDGQRFYLAHRGRMRELG